MPKSATLSTPAFETIRFDGLMSRWTTAACVRELERIEELVHELDQLREIEGDAAVQVLAEAGALDDTPSR
jgi:hypothetical protein